MRTTNLGKLYLCLILTTFLSVSLAMGQSCNSKLNAFKNRDAKSVAVNMPVNFQLTLANNSSKSETYQLAVETLEQSCQHDGKTLSTTKSPQAVNVSFIQNKNRTNTLTIPAKSSMDFLAEVSVPAGTEYDQWICVSIIARSSTCTQNLVNETIKIYVRNPSEN